MLYYEVIRWWAGSKYAKRYAGFYNIKGTWVQILMKGTFSLLKTQKPRPGVVNIYNTEMSNQSYVSIKYNMYINKK